MFKIFKKKTTAKSSYSPPPPPSFEDSLNVGLSTSMLQRKYRLGYSKATEIMDALEERKAIGKYRGTTPREIFVDKEELKDIISCLLYGEQCLPTNSEYSVDDKLRELDSLSENGWEFEK